jgi:DNA-binding HxlR family transcriptional regulator
VREINEKDVEFSRLLVDQVSDPWTLRIFWALCPGSKPARFNEIKRRVGAISQKTLTRCLRRLERNGILERRVIAAKPLGVEYSVTALGLSLEKPMGAMYDWAKKHEAQVRRAQASYDRKARI